MGKVGRDIEGRGLGEVGSSLSTLLLPRPPCHWARLVLRWKRRGGEGSIIGSTAGVKCPTGIDPSPSLRWSGGGLGGGLCDGVSCP